MIKPCHDCGAEPGALHILGCDTEVCPVCGGQLIGCMQGFACHHCNQTHYYTDCAITDDPNADVQELITDENRIPWSGEWPGVMECREFGWYAYFVPYGKPPFVRCDKDHPGASEDLNRLHDGEAVWDREKRRYVLRD